MKALVLAACVGMLSVTTGCAHKPSVSELVQAGAQIEEAVTDLTKAYETIKGDTHLKIAKQGFEQSLGFAKAAITQLKAKNVSLAYSNLKQAIALVEKSVGLVKDDPKMDAIKSDVLDAYKHLLSAASILGFSPNPQPEMLGSFGCHMSCG